MKKANTQECRYKKTEKIIVITDKSCNIIVWVVDSYLKKSLK